MDKERIKLLGETPVRDALIKLSIPSIIAMLINAVYNLVDTFFIGQLNNAGAMAAAAVAFPLMMLVGSVGGMFGIGGGSYLSRLLGEKDYEKANQATSISFFTSLILSIVITIPLYIFLEDILSVFGATPTIMPYALDYSKILVIGNIITMLNMTMNNLLRAEGAAKQSMISFLLGSGLNIILDPIFIFTLGFGVKGAAIATMIGKIVSFIYLISYYLRGKSIAKISTKYFKPAKEIYSEIFKIGIPSFLRQGLSSLSMGFMNGIAMAYGDNVIAGMGVSLRVVSISFFLLFGFSTGFQPLAGYSYGAKNYNRLNESLNIAIRWATGISLAFFIVFITASEPIIRIFIDIDEVVGYGVRFMTSMSILMPFIGFQIIVSTLFQALGKAKEALLLSVARQGLFLFPALIILPNIFELNGVIYSQPLADGLTLILTTILFIGIKKEISNSTIDTTKLKMN